MSASASDRSRVRRALALAVASTAVVAIAPAATASSTITVTLVAGTLSITEPGSSNFGNVNATVTGETVSGHLGTTTVTDSRASLAGWSVSISATNLSDGATPTPHTIAASKMKAFVGVGDGPTVTSGIAVPVTTYTTSGAALTLSTSGQAFLAATTTGSNVVTYNPTLVVTLDTSVVAGTYTGTITQTVA